MMEFKLPDLKDYRFYAIAFLIYLIIALVMFWPLTINLNSYVVNGGGDTYQSLWGLWWVPFSLFTLHQSPYVTDFVYYPIGANLVSQTMTPLAGIITAPLQLIGLPFTYNFLFFTSFALGGLFMFMLAFYLVKNNYAAFIAGLVFAFSPMHVAQSYSHLQWAIIEFIPLFVLCFLLMIRTKKWIYSIFGAIAFVLLTFAGDVEQALIMAVFVIVSLIVLLIIERKELLNRHFLINIVLLVVATVIIASPFIIWILPNLSSAAGGASQLNDIAHNMYYSDQLASFFLPSYFNGIFHGLSLSYFKQLYGLTYQGLTYTPNDTEKISYIGFSVIFLVLFAFYHEHRKNKMRDIWYWIVILIVFALFALGPTIQIFNSNTGIPGPYLAYRAIPLFNLVREPGRFDVIVTLALAVLAAIGFDHLSKSKYGTGVGAGLLAVVFCALILIEYNGMPLSNAFAHVLIENATIPSAYRSIGNATGNFTVLVLPAFPNITTGSFHYPGLAMYYQTAFRKPIIGGYTTRVNATEQQSLEDVPLIESSAYLQSGEGLIFPYPIDEDFSNLTLFWLSAYRVGVVAVINNAYTQPELTNLDSYLYSIFGNPTYQDSNVTIFSTSEIEYLEGGQSLVSYTAGTWIPGYEFCTSSQACNQTVATTWWGSNVRAITIYSPTNEKVNINFQAISYNPAPLYFFFDNSDTPFATFNLTDTSILNYSTSIVVPKGLSQIALYEPNESGAPGSYINFGIKNITFTR